MGSEAKQSVVPEKVRFMREFEEESKKVVGFMDSVVRQTQQKLAQEQEKMLNELFFKAHRMAPNDVLAAAQAGHIEMIHEKGTSLFDTKTYIVYKGKVFAYYYTETQLKQDGLNFTNLMTVRYSLWESEDFDKSLAAQKETIRKSKERSEKRAKEILISSLNLLSKYNEEKGTGGFFYWTLKDVDTQLIFPRDKRSADFVLAVEMSCIALKYGTNEENQEDLAVLEWLEKA